MLQLGWPAAATSQKMLGPSLHEAADASGGDVVSTVEQPVEVATDETTNAESATRTRPAAADDARDLRVRSMREE